MVVRGMIRESGQRGRNVRAFDVGADERDVHLGQLAGEELEQQQRRVVGAVEVVEDEEGGESRILAELYAQVEGGAAGSVARSIGFGDQ